ncbi:MAG: HAMP domain-containing protein, partial [Woeseiaceae bacterium]
MDARTLKRAFYVLLAATGVGLALIALFLLSRTAQNSADFNRLHIIILSFNVMGVIVLFMLLVGNLARLLRDYRTNVPGAKLKARIVGMFVGLAVVPLLVVFYFSVQFINRGIDTWFNVEVEEGFDNAIKLSRAALELQMRDNLFATQQIARQLSRVAERNFIFELSMLRRESGASEITLFGPNARIVATSSANPSASLPKPPSEEIALLTIKNPMSVQLDPVDTGSYEIRTAVLFTVRGRAEPVGVLQAYFPVAERIGRMAQSVEESYKEYQQMVFLREPLKSTLTLTLTVVLMLSLLAAIYAAFVLSRRLVAPIQDLVAGTRAVAQGDFDTRLPTPSRDEIGFLISSFNDMTQRLATARREASLSQALVEADRHRRKGTEAIEVGEMLTEVALKFRVGLERGVDSAAGG